LLLLRTLEGDKVARAQAVSPRMESCNVYLPHPAIAPWVEGFIDECSSFPNGKYDDQVDQMTQVLNRLRGATSPAKKPSTSPRRRRAANAVG
jgi:phage terminase large subunit-like protein